jgi:signal-transduction protein with cAMP-binding, CBS, and nucleotidyltransferase domain
MSIGEICDKRVPTAPAATTVLAAVKSMHSCGDRMIVVTDERGGRRVAVGVVTDYELLGVMAQGEDPSQITVRDIMCPCPAFVSEADDVIDTLCWMHRHHLRDVIVHGKGGALLGTVSLNQLADSVASELSEVASSPEAHCVQGRALH